MDIAGIDKLQRLHKVANKGSVQQAAQLEDSLSISSEAQKKEGWVENLKQMSDMRPEKIKAALSSHYPENLFAEVARKIQSSG
jgi:hypothetical protein